MAAIDRPGGSGRTYEEGQREAEEEETTSQKEDE